MIEQRQREAAYAGPPSLGDRRMLAAGQGTDPGNPISESHAKATVSAISRRERRCGQRICTRAIPKRVLTSLKDWGHRMITGAPYDKVP